ncbi:MAG: FtsH protease activity modulator HflK [Pirellulales bacterium]|nr:FtsH protease activity modulator HflK [Pirellulales bacterium]
MSSDGSGNWRDRGFDPENIRWDELTKWVWLVWIGLAVVVLGSVGMSMVYDIGASEEGVVLRFGKTLQTVPPGLHWKLPWPIDTVYKVPVQRIQTLEFGFATQRPGRMTQYAPETKEDLAVSEMLTGDLNLGNVEWIVQYRVNDPVQYLFKIGSTEVADWRALSNGTQSEVNPAVPDTIRDISESVVRKLVGDSSIDYVLTIGRDQIAKQAQVLLQKELDGFEAGVDIITVKLQTTSPPTAEVQDAFQEVNRARQKKEKVVNEAQGERNSKIPAARGAKEKAIAEAEGYRNRVELVATGQINAFLAQLEEYNKAPEVTRKRLYLEAMEEVLANVSQKTIIDETVPGVLPLLNLESGSSIPSVGQGVAP